MQHLKYEKLIFTPYDSWSILREDRNSGVILTEYIHLPVWYTSCVVSCALNANKHSNLLLEELLKHDDSPFSLLTPCARSASINISVPVIRRGCPETKGPSRRRLRKRHRVPECWSTFAALISQLHVFLLLNGYFRLTMECCCHGNGKQCSIVAREDLCSWNEQH